ncbi:MAG: hypothetical protein J6B31_04405 [Bacteroidaceae bacterium]|nr:hypothetical protein [Bacteroidaceae bacterium]
MKSPFTGGNIALCHELSELTFRTENSNMCFCHTNVMIPKNVIQQRKALTML